MNSDVLKVRILNIFERYLKCRFNIYPLYFRIGTIKKTYFEHLQGSSALAI